MDDAVSGKRVSARPAAAGADVIQARLPWLRNDPTPPSRFAVKAITARSKHQITGADRPCICCFGERFWSATSRSRILPVRLADSKRSRSIESAQPKSPSACSRTCRRRPLMLGVINLVDQIVERPEQVAGRIRAALKHTSRPSVLSPRPMRHELSFRAMWRSGKQSAGRRSPRSCAGAWLKRLQRKKPSNTGQLTSAASPRSHTLCGDRPCRAE